MNKLYTEEQVWKMYNLYDTNLDQDGCCIMDEYKHFEQCIKTLKPIELPSDEEIANMVGRGGCDYEGAIWMKEQILNQNK